VYKLSILFLLCVFNTHAKQEINLTQLQKKIALITKAFMEENNFIGMQTMVLYKNDIIFNKGFGYADIKRSQPFLDNTIVALGSNTKEFTSTAIQLLKSKELINFDDKIEMHLSNKLVNGSNVTVRQLLCHTSGLPDFFNIEKKYDPNVTSFNSIISTTATLPKRFAAGDRYEYNNTGYLLLGKLIEKLSGQSLGDYYRENIIAPLKLNNTYFLGDTFYPMNMSKSYDVIDNKVILFNSTHENYAEYRISSSAGGLGGSLSDFMKWHTAILKGYLLPKESIDEMITPCTTNDGSKTRYGLGMEIRSIDNEIYYNHGGATNGFVSDALYFPNRDLTIAFVANSWKNPTKYKYQLVKEVLGWLKNKTE
jgi:CubicO group peptidase (beta-lactamase class C family)